MVIIGIVIGVIIGLIIMVVEIKTAPLMPDDYGENTQKDTPIKEEH